MNKLTTRTLGRKRNVYPKIKAVGKCAKVTRGSPKVQGHNRGPVDTRVTGWPTRDDEVIPWTLSRANDDGSITVFGGQVAGRDLNNERTKEKGGNSGGKVNLVGKPGSNLRSASRNVVDCVEVAKPNKRPARNKPELP